MKRRLLLMDHNPELLQALKMRLEAANFDVTATLNGLEGLRLAYRMQPDAVILDLDLPDQDGWTACQRLRAMSDVPIMAVMASASKAHLVRALDLGADDFMAKPFNWDEFSARLQALIRRAKLNAQQPGGQRSGAQRSYALLLDDARHTVTVRGRSIELTPLEFRLLACLHRHVGRVLPHHYLLLEVWGPQYVDRTNYVKLYIRYLREKIEDDPRNPQFIHTEWGVGYYLSEL
jgi:two-component system KDP operon response regulator KdpE